MSDGLGLLKPFLPGLEDVLEDPEVSEIMINGPHNVWIEGHGKLYSHEAPLLTACGASKGRHPYRAAARPGPGLGSYRRCAPERRLAGCHLRSTSQPEGCHHRATVWQTGILSRRPGGTRSASGERQRVGGADVNDPPEHPGFRRHRIGQDHSAKRAH